MVKKGMKMKSFALRTLLGFTAVAGALLIISSGSPGGQPSRDYFGDNEPVLISPDSPALIRRPAAPEEAAVITEAESKPVYRSPMHVCFSPDGRRAYVVNQTSDSVSMLDVRTREVVDEIPVPPQPTHAALSPDGRTLYVTSLYANALAVLDVERRRHMRKIETGYGPYGVTVSADGKKLYVANSLSDTLSIIDVKTGETVFETPVGRNPRYVAEARNSARLVVTNSLSRDVSLVDPASGKLLETRKLGEGAIPRQVACSRDGKWSFVVHLVSRDLAIPTQLERGFTHSNGFSVLDLETSGFFVTLLLDHLLDGASNPWGAVVSSKWLYVSLAGVHEVAIVNLQKAVQLARESYPEEVERLAKDVEILLLRKIARRVDAGGLGPRGIALHEGRNELWVCNYFSDTVSVLNAMTGAVEKAIPLGPPQEMTLRRKGELLFNDAIVTFQRWASCASCHQEDATMDAFNWDLLNDGAGNPKNVKSLRDVHDTPPAMWAGVRKDMEVAVAAGQRFMGFLPDPEYHEPLTAFIGSLRRLPNPHRGKNTEAVKRGERLYRQARCDACHMAPSYSDNRKHDLGLAAEIDLRSRFDTPALRDCYRTAPYLHDGRAQTLKEIFTDHNPNGTHGLVRGFSDEDLDDMVAYLRTL
jgi:YVTN family beta-propeller protein